MLTLEPGRARRANRLQHHGSATLALPARATGPFNWIDLERGNPDKGLTGGVGAGQGDWRLALTGDVAIDVYGYIRHTDGFVTSVHDAAPVRDAPVGDTHHRIAFLNPGSNRAQVSLLRLINPGDSAASVTVAGRDHRREWADRYGAAATVRTLGGTMPGQCFRAGGSMKMIALSKDRP